ncbi:MAG: hypothetical protein COT71_01700 [Candidatus Andersenbacteria bacterium CG10_big_fil_rev_8_21_14_0_10_54_11]|uniref:Glycosyltransferase family 1 protein n=1 Tax=Candidatus Andersenbacteria bacterium CG10_big_fil_rev_8_21_14_0_10_54_11 TaxID=1974485 RepID=A0A2M6WZP5_9BACT|nr:MAG: hypothetical protein COT71_01700 [Candidatus Andersenbacteria bacterium CG10_big_fil_rev_8_21_14_0_10_54_11]
MKVAIEARALAASGGGVRRYAEELVRHLAELPGQDTFEVLREGPAHEALLSWWMNVTLPQRMASLAPDVVHFTKSAIPRRKIAPTVVTIYDVIPLLFPESQRLSRRWYWPRALRQAAQESDHIVTISEASRRDIAEHLQVAEAKITVTPLAVDTKRFQPQTATDFVRKMSGGDPYVLYVGRIDVRKNVPILVRAYAHIAGSVPHRLVIAGPVYNDTTVAAAIRTSGVSERVTRLPYVPEGELAALYANADLFVWPSIYEGWGFPPQEAMACGTPVIVSDGGPLPEVVGEAGVVVPFTAPLRERTADTDFEQRLTAAMEEVLADEAKRAAMRRAGLVRAQQFSWQQVAEQTLVVYRRAAR